MFLTTYTTEYYPKGYTLIRHGMFFWTWRFESEAETYRTDHYFRTPRGALKHMREHDRLMKEDL